MTIKPSIGWLGLICDKMQEPGRSQGNFHCIVGADLFTSHRWWSPTSCPVISQVQEHFWAPAAPALSVATFDPSAGALDAGGCWQLCNMEFGITVRNQCHAGVQMILRPNFIPLSGLSRCPINANISLIVGWSSKKKMFSETLYGCCSGYWITSLVPVHY